MWSTDGSRRRYLPTNIPKMLPPPSPFRTRRPSLRPIKNITFIPGIRSTKFSQCLAKKACCPEAATVKLCPTSNNATSTHARAYCAESPTVFFRAIYNTRVCTVRSLASISRLSLCRHGGLKDHRALPGLHHIHGSRGKTKGEGKLGNPTRTHYNECLCGEEKGQKNGDG